MANEVEVVVRSTDKTEAAYASARQRASGFSTAMKGIGRVAGGALAANFVMGAGRRIVDFFADMNAEAREAELVARSTAQGIKTIGAASWTSAKQIGELSQKISEKVGVDDEAIQSSANLLLTFKEIRNQTGHMNNVFDRALMATQDLSKKGFGDADAAAKMLGKALNDPIKGMTALGKAGVTFTQAQKDQIKAMVESGDLLGAQKMLLAEIEAQVGGTAEATATGADKMKVKWANLKEELGTKLLPVIDKLIPVAGKLMDAIGPPLAEAIAKIGPAIERNMPAIMSLARTFGDLIVWAAQHPVLVAAIMATTAVLGPLTAAIRLLNVAMAANPILLIISLIALLVTAFITLWENSAAFRDFFINLWEVIKLVVQGAVDGIVAAWNWLWQAGHNVKEGIITAFWAVVDFFKKLPGRIGEALAKVWDIITWPFRQAFNWIRDRVSEVAGHVRGAVNSALAALGLLQTNLSRQTWSGHKPRKRHGGIVGSAATGGIRSAATIINEGGAELVELPSGSRVMTAGSTRAMAERGLLGGGGRGGEVRWIVDTAGAPLDELVAELIRRYVKPRGGNVQAVLGQG